jgi:hypothetical protein
MRIIVGIVVFLALGSSVAVATSIVAVRNNDEVVIGADSKTTLTREGGATGDAGSISKCKIIQAGNLFFASAGYAGIGPTEFPGDIDPGFNLEKIVTEGLRGNGGIAEKMSSLEKAIVANLSRIANEAKRNNPAFFVTRFLEHPPYTIMVTGLDHGELVLMVRKFRLITSPSGSVSFDIGRFDCPGNCEEPSVTVLEGRSGAIRKYLQQHVLFLYYADPITAVRNLVGLEIEEDPSSVGPPIDILRLTRKGAEWIQKKPLCPDILGEKAHRERKPDYPTLFSLR